MKKQLLTGAFVLASFLTLQAQETIYTQGFEDFDEVFPEDETLPSWGSVDIDGDGESFNIYSSDPTLTGLGINGQAAGSPNFTTNAQGQITGNTVDADNFFLSVGLNIPAAESAYVSFKALGIPLETGATSPYTVVVLTEADITALNAATTAEEFAAALDAVTPALVVDNAPATATLTSVDLSDYAGQTVIVGFRHKNTGDLANYLFIDDFTAATGVLATDKFLASSLSVFPSPATDVINVANAENILVNGVTVTDINGRTVKNVKFAGVSEAQINVSDLASGVYVVTVSSDKGTLTKKVVKN